MNEYTGSWRVRPGGVRVPVLEPEPTKILCRVCGAVSPVGLCRPCRESVRERVHGSHAGYAQHKRRNEPPCQACSDAEKAYQRARYRRGQLSDETRKWCEKQAVAWSWVMDTKANRR